MRRVAFAVALALALGARGFAAASAPVQPVVDPWHDIGALDAPAELEATPSPRALWEGEGLALLLERADEHGLELCLTLRPGARSAAAAIGPARYRTRSGRWQEAALRPADVGARVVLDDAKPRECFGIAAAPGSTLRLAVGGETIEIGPFDADGSVPSAPPPRRESAAPAPGAPVRLESDVRWEGAKPFGDGALDAGERGELLVDVTNRGERSASGLALTLEPPVDHVDFPASLAVADLAPGARTTVRVPFQAGAELASSTLHLVFRVREPFGHDAAPIEVELAARGEPLPELELTDDLVVAGYGLPAPRDAILTLELRVRNVGAGTAHDVVARVSPGADVFPARDTQDRFELGELGPGATAELVYRCYANRQAEQLALEVELGHARSAGAPSRALLTLPLDDDWGPPRVVRIEADPQAPPALAPAPPPLASDVDRGVPEGALARPTGLAVVLGVERYAGLPPARFAADDARTAARYFEHALGIPRTRIELLLEKEVTLGALQRVFGPGGWLARRAAADSDVFVFFAGHGVSTAASFDPYLLPADGDPGYLEQTALPLARVVDWLGALDVRSTSLFVDACFSGRTREGDTLFAGSRPLVVVPVGPPHPSGLSLYSAARGAQIAGTLDAQAHGLFSYYLFRGLAGAADADGDRRITAGELARWLEREVPAAAAAADREQQPSIVLDDESRLLVELP